MAKSNTVGVEVTAQIEGYKAALKEAMEKTHEFQEKITEIGKLALEITGIGLGIEAFKHYVESMAELGLETERTAIRLGVTNQAVVEMSGFAKLTGTSIDAMTTSLERMSLGVQKSTRDAFSPQAQAIKALGINAKEFVALPTEKKFETIAEAVSKFNPSLNLSNIVTTAFSRGVTAMLPSLIKGAAGFHEITEEVKHASDGLAAAVPGMAQTHEKITLLGLSMQSLGARIFTVLKPAIDGAVHWLTEFVQSLSAEKIKAAISTMTTGIANGLIAVIQFFNSVIEVIDTAVTKIASFFGYIQKIGTVAAMVAKMHNPQFGRGPRRPDVPNENVGADLENVKPEGLADRMSAAIRKASQDFLHALDAIGHGEDEHGKKKKDADALNFEARKQAQIKKLIEERAKMGADFELQAEDEKDKQRLALGQITEEQYLKLHLDMLMKKAAADEASLAKERDIYPKGSLEWERAENSRIKASNSANLQITAASGKLVEEQKKLWLDLAKSINSSIETGLSSVIQSIGDKTKKLSDIINNFLASLKKAFSDFAAKNIMNMVLGSVSAAGGGGQGIGGLLAGLIPKHAIGGTILPGQWGIAGDNGPELIYGGQGGASVTPNSAMGGRSGGDVTQHIYVNNPTGDAGIEEAVARGVARANATAAAGLSEYNRRLAGNIRSQQLLVA